MDFRVLLILAFGKTQDAVTISAEHHYSRYFQKKFSTSHLQNIKFYFQLQEVGTNKRKRF